MAQEDIVQGVSINMPVMLRPKGEITKIANKVLGKTTFKQSPTFKQASKEVAYQNTSRLR